MRAGTKKADPGPAPRARAAGGGLASANAPYTRPHPETEGRGPVRGSSASDVSDGRRRQAPERGPFDSCRRTVAACTRRAEDDSERTARRQVFYKTRAAWRLLDLFRPTGRTTPASSPRTAKRRGQTACVGVGPGSRGPPAFRLVGPRTAWPRLFYPKRNISRADLVVGGLNPDLGSCSSSASTPLRPNSSCARLAPPRFITRRTSAP